MFPYSDGKLPCDLRTTLIGRPLNHVLQAMHYLLLVSEVEEVEIFKVCLEYWNSLTSELYRETPFSSTSPLLLSKPQDMPLRRHTYNAVLSKVSRRSRRTGAVTSSSRRCGA